MIRRALSSLAARRAATLVLAALVVLAAAGLGAAGWRLVVYGSANRAIADLAAGRDLAVADDAPGRVLLARAHFLLRRDLLTEAQPLVDRLARGSDAALAVAALYDMANARLLLAIDLLERNEIDPAVPQVRLAKAGYRATLARAPDFFDAKYNLDVAMRLVRDFPQVEQEEKDEPQDAPKRVWTDLPGLPKGLP